MMSELGINLDLVIAQVLNFLIAVAMVAGMVFLIVLLARYLAKRNKAKEEEKSKIQDLE